MVWYLSGFYCIEVKENLFFYGIFIFLINSVMVYVLNLEIFFKWNFVLIFGLLKNGIKLYIFVF